MLDDKNKIENSVQANNKLIWAAFIHIYTGHHHHELF